MNENLLKAVDALINDDETMASEYLRQALVDKVRQRLGINENINNEPINESVTTFSHALKYDKMINNKDKEIKKIANAILQKFGSDALDNLKQISQGNETLFDKVIKPLYPQYEIVASVFIEQHYSEISAEIKKMIDN